MFSKYFKNHLIVVIFHFFHLYTYIVIYSFYVFSNVKFDCADACVDRKFACLKDLFVHKNSSFFYLGIAD